MNFFIKVNNLDLLELWNALSEIPKLNRSQCNACLHLDNSLKFQYDSVIRFNNSLNSKTTAVLIGCFVIEQSSYTWREELWTNNVKAKTCLFTGQVDVQHMPFTYVSYNPCSRDNNLWQKNTKEKPKKNVPSSTSWPFKKRANIPWTTISAQILHENKTK